MNLLSTKTALRLLVATFFLAQVACTPPSVNEAKVAAVNASVESPSKPTSPEFAKYWFAGKGELNSYDLTINRYGENRKGYAVMVFVTEDLSDKKHVKLDNPDQAGNDRVSVLKLNHLQRFNTGVYDYSMMTSLFTPLDYGKHPHSLKWTTTVQDWCGHVFTQLDFTKGNTYRAQQFSYFETEGDKAFDTEGGLLEDEILTRLRLNPDDLPKGKVKIIPNLTYSRIRHKPIEGIEATIQLSDGASADQRICTIQYVNKRRFEVVFEKAFPHKILAFKELDGNEVLSQGTLKQSFMSDYWSKHNNASAYLREQLGI
jgi:hypothetical protein